MRQILFTVLCILYIITSAQISNSPNSGVQAGRDINYNYPVKKNINDSLEEKVIDQFKNDYSSYKILIFPFRQDTKFSDCEKQYGTDIYEHLEYINSVDSLNISVGWLTNDYQLDPNFKTIDFESKGKALGADLIIYGNYDKICTANSDNGEVCVKYISLYGKEKKIDGSKVVISNIQSSQGQLVTPVKGLLYKVMAMKNKSLENKFYYYSRLAINNGAVDPVMFVQILYKQVNQYPPIYKYNEFHEVASKIIVASSRLTYDDGLAEIYLNLSKAYMVYGEYDTAFQLVKNYLEWGSLSPEGYDIAFYCANKLKNDSLQREAISVYQKKVIDVNHTYNGNYGYGLRRYYIYKSISYEKLNMWDDALMYLDSANLAVNSIPYYYSSDHAYSDYYIEVYTAFIYTKLKKYDLANRHLFSADSIDRATCNLIQISGGVASVGVMTITSDTWQEAPTANSSVEYWISTPFTESSIYNSWARNYLPDTPYCHYAYIYNGNIFKTKCLLYVEAGQLDSAYYWYTYYIDTTSNYISSHTSVKRENWPNRSINSIVPLNFEDYYNRALLGIRLNTYDKVNTDIDMCLSLNRHFEPALKIKEVLNKNRNANAVINKLKHLNFSFVNLYW